MKIVVSNRAEITDAPKSVVDLIASKLSMPNPKYLEAVRFNRFRGNIPRILRGYEKKDGSLFIPRGFVGQAARMMPGCEIADLTRSCPDVSFDSRITLKDYQAAASSAVERYRFGTLSSPTGSGKTVMALHLIAQRKQPTLVIVHTKELLNQWATRANEFLGIPKKEIGLIGNGKFSIGNRLTVALVQSVYKRAGEIKPRIGHLIIDECHRTPSRTFTEAASAFDCKYVLGLSATPYRRDDLSDLIFWYIGPLRHEVPKGALIADGQIMSADIIIRRTEFESDFDAVTEYSKVIEDLVNNEARNELIARDCANVAHSSPGIVLVLSDRKLHCDKLQESIRKFFDGETAVLTGETKKDLRDDIVKRLDSGRIKVLIATGQLIGEGFDCKWLSSLLICTPIKFGGRLIQYLGRVLRPAVGKMRATVIDYIDDQLWKAANGRLKIYKG